MIQVIMPVGKLPGAVSGPWPICLVGKELGADTVKYCPKHPGSVLFRCADGSIGGSGLSIDGLAQDVTCRDCGGKLKGGYRVKGDTK